MTYKFDIGSPEMIFTGDITSDNVRIFIAGCNAVNNKFDNQPIIKWLKEKTPNHIISLASVHDYRQKSHLVELRDRMIENKNVTSFNIYNLEDIHIFVVKFEDKNDAIFFNLMWQGKLNEGWIE